MPAYSPSGEQGKRSETVPDNLIPRQVRTHDQVGAAYSAPQLTKAASNEYTA